MVGTIFEILGETRKKKKIRRIVGNREYFHSKLIFWPLKNEGFTQNMNVVNQDLRSNTS